MSAIKQEEQDQPKKKTGWKGPPGSINTKGRPVRPEGYIPEKDKPTNRELRERELLMLMRKIRPHVADAIMQAAKIMKNEEAAHQNQLKAATILLDNYRRLALDLYDSEDPDAEATEVQQQNTPVFSLRMISDEEKPTDKG
jgi:hypothetical protein